MVFGPRTCRKAETVQVETPARNLAPVKAIELVISGPTAEVAALKKKIDRPAFTMLLGPIGK
jgi:hypothetical protein